MSDTVTLTIDGLEITVAAGTTILDAAAELGIDIPVICYHPHLTGNGLCRICSVDGGGRVQFAASTADASAWNVQPQLRSQRARAATVWSWKRAVRLLTVVAARISNSWPRR